MDFTILSHAGLRVRHGKSELICDPWIIGSTYWRSWWNFPSPSRQLVESLNPSCIYLTHVHWDHFAGPSLRRFSKDTEIVIPLEPVGRMRDDLVQMGFRNIVELGWGATHRISSDISLTSYPFNVFTDSAVVIEADGVTILNCNDTKLMGAPLKDLLQRHRKIDFVLRSHSSANSRAVTHVIGSTASHIDNRENYIDDFIAFAESTKAAFAIPFASNHCHLHPDVLAYNAYIVTPEEVLDQSLVRGTTVPVRVMMPGDGWSKMDQWQFATKMRNLNRQEMLNELQSENSERIHLSTQRENNAKFNFQRFSSLVVRYFSPVPSFVRRRFRRHPILFVLLSGGEAVYVAVNVYSMALQVETPEHIDKYGIRIEAPLMIVSQCLALRLFSHLAISKRAHYYATPASLAKLKELSLLFNFIEYDYFPLKGLLTKRFILAWAARWRELVLYSRIAFDMLVCRKPFAYRRYLGVPTVPSARGNRDARIK